MSYNQTTMNDTLSTILSDTIPTSTIGIVPGTYTITAPQVVNTTFSNVHWNTVPSMHDISLRIEKIEERLAILTPNEKLEAKWEELKKLREAYIALEKEILEKEKIWDTLQK